MKTLALGALLAATLAAPAALAQQQPAAAGRLPDPLAAPQAAPQQAAPAAAPAAPAPRQAQPPRQPVTPTRHGAAVNGVCTYNLLQVLDQSTAGRSITGQAQALSQQIDTEENASGLQQQLQAYEGQPVSSVPQALQGQIAVYERRQEILRNQVAEHRRALSAEIQYGGALSEAYEARNCSLLLEDSQVIFSRPSYDITATVTERTNTKTPNWMQLQAIPRLQYQAPAAQAPAQAPAQPPARSGARRGN